MIHQLDPVRFEDLTDRFLGAGHEARPDFVLAEVVDGRLDLAGIDGRIADRLLELHGRLTLAVVEGRPRPIELQTLRGGDRLIDLVEREWRSCGRGFLTDPDVPGWSDVLEERTRSRFIEWCFGLLSELGHGTVDRFDAVVHDETGVEETWTTSEPDLLEQDLRRVLQGRMVESLGDPLRTVRRLTA